MTNGLTAASCAAHQRTRFVWISDALLADSFNRFCRQRRHGSSVPGPLEAQRRAAKRKNTSLAHAGPGGLSVDQSIFLGSKSKVEWWQSPADLQEKPAASRLLPAWFLPFSYSPPDLSPGRAKTSPEKTSITQTAVDDLLEPRDMRMPEFQSLADAQRWIREEKINLSQDLAAAAALQRRIQKFDFCADDIASYICDPMFHPSGTSFILQLLPELLHHTWDGPSWKILSSSLSKATELGLISVSDLKAIVTEVVEKGPTRLRSSDNRVKVVNATLKLRLVHGILQSLARSKVLKVADLGSDFLSNLFSRLAPTPRSQRSRSKLREAILWELIPWARAVDAPVISEATVAHLRNECRKGLHDEVGRDLVDRFENVNTGVLCPVLLCTTERLVVLAREKDTMFYRYLFYHWMGVLALLGSTRQNVVLKKHDWDLQRSSPNNLSPDQRLLVFAWTFMHLYENRRIPVKMTQRQYVHEHLRETLRTISEATRGFVDGAKIGIKDLPLPRRQALLRHLGNLVSDDNQTSVANTVTQSGFWDEDTLRISETSSSGDTEVLGELVEILRHNIPLYKVLSRRMIQESAGGFDLMFRVLEAIICFKAGSPEGFPHQNSNVDEATWSTLNLSNEGVGAVMRPLGCLPVDMPSPSAEEAIDLINHMAVSFATSAAVSPRVSLRKVHWCYANLRRYGRPILPVITRALWYAGVTRYGGERTAPPLLEWILLKVKQVEGEAVAKQLFWSESFRMERQRELEALSKVDEAEEERLLAGPDGGKLHASSSSPPSSLRARLTKVIQRGAAHEIQLVMSDPPPDEPVWFEKPVRTIDWFLNQGGAAHERGRTQRGRKQDSVSKPQRQAKTRSQQAEDGPNQGSR